MCGKELLLLAQQNSSVTSNFPRKDADLAVGVYLWTMLTLRAVHQLQDQHGVVQLRDGRVGKIVRVTTTFPANHTQVSVYTIGPDGPGISKLELEELFPVADAS